jgi:hypothetical protein
MNWPAIFSKLLDPYDMKARIFPGLLLLVPVIVFMALVLGPKNPLIVTLSSILATCGGPYLLASFVRTWGQRAQDRLNNKWGGQPSTIMLRHRDSRMTNLTKLQYHQLIEQKLSIKMPTAAEEAADSYGADGAYTSAANALRPLTGDVKKFPFVFKELVAYGFNRNSYGSRWVGVLICLATITATVLHAGFLILVNPYININAQSRMEPVHLIILVIAVAFLGMWLFHFTAKTVEQAGYSYAHRLWESLLMIRKAATKIKRGQGNISE